MDAGALSALMAKNLLWKEGENDAAGENLDIAVKLNDIVVRYSSICLFGFTAYSPI